MMTGLSESFYLHFTPSVMIQVFENSPILARKRKPFQKNQHHQSWTHPNFNFCKEKCYIWKFFSTLWLHICIKLLKKLPNRKKSRFWSFRRLKRVMSKKLRLKIVLGKTFCQTHKNLKQNQTRLEHFDTWFWVSLVTISKRLFLKGTLGSFDILKSFGSLRGQKVYYVRYRLSLESGLYWNTIKCQIAMTRVLVEMIFLK